MPRCPVCQTKFLPSKTDYCPTCRWDLQALPFWVGLIPEVVQKEAARLEWAKQVWKLAKPHQLQQLQQQVEEIRDREQQLQAQLQQVTQAHTDQLTRVEQQIQALSHGEQQRQCQLEQVTQENIDLLGALQERERIVAYLQTQINAIHQSPPLLPNQSQEIAPPNAGPLVAVASRPVAIAEFVIEMQPIPGGTFWMGSPATEAERDINEGPQHQVVVAAFQMGKFPITQAQWRSVAALPKIDRSLSLYPAEFEGDDRPIEQVSWHDAIEFCHRLSRHTGHHYRLPSEAEWEYACRAGTTTPFWVGDTLTPDLANYDGNYTYGDGQPGLYRQGTTSIGTFPALNAFGLADLHGNVWEWCADSWHANYQGAPATGPAWEDPEGATYRILRGGAWYCLPGLCRSAQRHWNQPDAGGSGIGFRVVRAEVDS